MRHRAQAHDPLPPIDPSFRIAPGSRSVSRRWLSAIVLVAGAGSALLGVAAARLCPPRASPAQLARWRGRTAPEGAAKGDRLASARAEADSRPAGRVRVEQLAGAAGDMLSHTYVSFDLGPRRTDAPDGAAAVDAAGPRQARPALPPQILFGAAAAPPSAPALAYAEGPGIGVEPPPLGDPVNVSTAEREPPAPPPGRRVIAARSGDALADTLRAVGLSAPDAAEAAAALAGRRWFSVPALTGDERITLDLERTADGDRPWRIALARPGEPVHEAALADDGHYRPVLEAGSAEADGDMALRGEEGDERQPLRAALAAAVRSRDLDPGLIDEAERLCSHDLDVERDVSAKDRAEMVIDEQGGRPRLASLRLEIDGRPYRYYRYDAPDDGSTDFYDPQGRSMTSFLLRKPVAAGRLGDGFGWRIHPVLGDRRFHQGVDYAAPFGSPIVAAGAGTVEKIDREWGYGRYVRIRHDLGYETTYAHIAAVPRGLAVGQRVHQGQTIAFVGSTGISTGPHLYYEVRINGHNVDPLTVRLAGGRILSGPALLAFSTARERLDGLFGVAQTISAR